MSETVPTIILANPEHGDSMSASQDRQTGGNVPNTIPGIQATPIRGGDKHSSSSCSQAHKATGTYETYGCVAHFLFRTSGHDTKPGGRI